MSIRNVLTSSIYCSFIALLFIAITYLAIMPSNVPVVDQANDKFKHILAFAVLAWGLSRYWSWPWRRVAGVLLAYGIGIEIVQAFVPGRYSSGLDVLADCVGIAVGVGASRLLVRRAV